MYAVTHDASIYVYHSKQKWMRCMLRHDGLLRDVLEGCWIKEQEEKEGYSFADDLAEKKNYTDLKRAAEN